MQKIITIVADKINSWDTFHSEFSKTFGFPDFYGKNMNAWIDCMSYIDDKEAGMTSFWINKNETLVIQLKNSENFVKNHSDIYRALLECTAFVNARMRPDGPIIAISVF